MSIQGVNGSIPFPAAAARRAYAGGGPEITPQNRTAETDRGAERIDKLIAGQVSSPVNRGEGFDPARPADPEPGATLQLYSRPADRVAAATQAALGRSVDLNG